MEKIKKLVFGDSSDLTPDQKSLYFLTLKVNEIIDYLNERHEERVLVSDCCGADLKGIVSADGLARCPECYEGCCAEEVEQIPDWKDGDILNTVDKDGVHHFILKEMKEVEEIPGFEGTLGQLDNLLKKKENE
jgi:hypothetical protein